jgi:Arc/MetJ-type ribon-helix-helix transcriptional regulator
MTETTDTAVPALLPGEAGSDPIKDRLRETVRATIEAIFDEELARGDATSSVSCEIMSLDRQNDQPTESSFLTEAPDMLIGIEACTEAELAEAPNTATREEEIVLKLPGDLLESIDRLVEAGHFASRNSFAHIALAEAIKARPPAGERPSSAGVRSVRRRKERVTGMASAPG